MWSACHGLERPELNNYFFKFITAVTHLSNLKSVQVSSDGSQSISVTSFACPQKKKKKKKQYGSVGHTSRYTPKFVVVDKLNNYTATLV